MSNELQYEESAAGVARISITGSRLVGRLEVKPNDQSRMALGTFTADNPPKGFSVGLTPDPKPSGSVATEVLSIGTTREYRLILHVANRGSRAVTAEVCRL